MSIAFFYSAYKQRHRNKRGVFTQAAVQPSGEEKIFTRELSPREQKIFGLDADLRKIPDFKSVLLEQGEMKIKFENGKWVAEIRAEV